MLKVDTEITHEHNIWLGQQLIKTEQTNPISKLNFQDVIIDTIYFSFNLAVASWYGINPIIAD